MSVTPEKRIENVLRTMMERETNEEVRTVIAKTIAGLRPAISEAQIMGAGAAAIARVQEQLTAVLRQWGSFASAHEGFGVLVEEVFELFEHVAEKQERRNLDAMRKEGCDVAVVGIKMMILASIEALGRDGRRPLQDLRKPIHMLDFDLPAGLGVVYLEKCDGDPTRVGWWEQRGVFWHPINRPGELRRS